MSARILYVEKKVFDEVQVSAAGDVYGPYQVVLVELRQWKDGAHHDTIIEERVVVDGEEVVNSTCVLGGFSDASHIRHAIERFDAHVSAHPWANGVPTSSGLPRATVDDTVTTEDQYCRSSGDW